MTTTDPNLEAFQKADNDQPNGHAVEPEQPTPAEKQGNEDLPTAEQLADEEHPTATPLERAVTLLSENSTILVALLNANQINPDNATVDVPIAEGQVVNLNAGKTIRETQQFFQQMRGG